MAAPLILLAVFGAAAVSGAKIRYVRDSSGSSSGSSSNSYSSSSSFSSSSGTKVAPGPGGYGNFNAFAGNFGGTPGYGSGGFGATGNSNQFGQPNGGASYGQSGSNDQFGQQPFGIPGFNPYIPQYGQQYPYIPFPNLAAPFDFSAFLNQYFQALQNFQAQAEHASSGFPSDSNEVGGSAFATYSPQGGYGSANIFPPAEGGLESRFGGNEETPQNSVNGPVTRISGSFKPPGTNSFGVFTSSSSGSSDVNGKKTSFKQSSIGVNDNGKVTTYTAHDP